MREDLIKSAVSFLSDPKVQSAPLAKKVSFLESKGMTSEEIEEAMSRVSGKAPSTPAAAQTAVAPYTATSQQPGAVVTAAAPPPPPIPPRPKYDWRDIFIAAVLAGGVGYGIWTLAKRVFGPWFKVPTEEQLEKDKQALDEQFQAVEDSLKEIKDQTQQALTSVSAQSDKVKDSLTSLEAVLEDLKKGDEQRDEEFRNVKGDIDALKEMVPKMLDRNKEAQNRVLEELQNELKSLKSLILSRRPQSPAVDGSSSPSENGLTSRLTAALNGTGNAKPGIPAWQQAAAATTKPTTSFEAEPAAASSPSSSAAAAAAAATNSNSEAAEASQEKQ